MAAVRDGRLSDTVAAIGEQIAGIHDGRLLGKWSLTCRVYSAIGDAGAGIPAEFRKGRRLLTLQTSVSRKLYAAVDGTRIIETEAPFEMIVSRAKNSWSSRLTAGIQVR